MIKDTISREMPDEYAIRPDHKVFDRLRSLREDAEHLLSSPKSAGPIEHSAVFSEILAGLDPVDFHELANIDRDKKVSQKALRVITVRRVLEKTSELDCGLAKNLDFIYAYNGAFWQVVDRSELEHFLGIAALRLGVEDITAADFEFKGKLLKQFLTDAYLPTPVRAENHVLINFKNGTFEIDGSNYKLREFRRNDFLTYQLPFEYSESAKYPKWQRFLDEVLPDQSKQQVLAEFFGYIFLRDLKLEKALLLYGTGANGKSVVFDVINAVLGSSNVENISLESLCSDYYRPKIANVLLNYSSDISSKLQSAVFKLLTSGEPIEARLPYGQPMTLKNYARLAFNCNELPRDVEHSEAYFRRFLIIQFDKTIPEEHRNPNLSREIIDEELPGVFNWILDGVNRLRSNARFTYSESIKSTLEAYRRESDSVAMFLLEDGWTSSLATVTIKSAYSLYRDFCSESGFRPLGKTNFSRRLESHRIAVRRTNVGNVAHMERA